MTLKISLGIKCGCGRGACPVEEQFSDLLTLMPSNYG